MKVYPLGADTLELFKRRLSAIESESQRKWGKLTPSGLMRHLRFMIEMSLGENVTVDQSNFITRAVLRPLFFQTPLPWPRGIAGPPSLTPAPDHELEGERVALFAALERFAAARQTDPDRRELHTIFGRQPLSYWALMHGRHFEHHFIQFGV